MKELRRLYDDYCNKLEPARQRCAAAIERLKEVSKGWGWVGCWLLGGGGGGGGP